MARIKRYNPETGAWEYADGLVVVGGGGVSSWNDLTDKPFYEESEEVDIFAEQEITLTVEEGMGMYDVTPAPFTLTEGDTYRVVSDGTEYTLVCESSNGVLALVNLILDENGDATIGSFQIIYASPEVAATEGGVLGIVFYDSNESHTLAIYHNSTVIKTLDEKFLPMDVIDARIDAYIEEALGGDY